MITIKACLKQNSAVKNVANSAVNSAASETLHATFSHRESEGAIEAEIFPDLEYAGKKKIKDMQGELQKIIDAYNKTAPLYKRVFKLSLRRHFIIALHHA